jgi:hypothetical protein
MSHPSPSSYDVGYSQAPQQATQSRKRSRAEDHLQHLDLPNPLAQQQPDPYAHAPGSIQVPPSHPGYSLQPFQQHPTPQSAAAPTHHHHHLPNQGPSNKRIRMEGAPPSPSQPHGPPNVVGHEGMPAPAPRPRGPKLKFTPEDDQLLVDLKEKKNLAWKQIADFFPGRSSGTLQVRYCTKLKAKTTVWTDEMVSALISETQDVESCALNVGNANLKGTHRSRSFAQQCTSTRTIVGGSLPQKSGAAFRRRHAETRCMSWKLGR